MASGSQEADRSKKSIARHPAYETEPPPDHLIVCRNSFKKRKLDIKGDYAVPMGSTETVTYEKAFVIFHKFLHQTGAKGSFEMLGPDRNSGNSATMVLSCRKAP